MPLHDASRSCSTCWERIAACGALKPPTNGSCSRADPLNLLGIAETAKRVAALGSRRIVYRDGVAVAALTGAGVDWLVRLTPAEQYRAQELLRRAPGARPGGGAARRQAGWSR